MGVPVVLAEADTHGNAPRRPIGASNALRARHQVHCGHNWPGCTKFQCQSCNPSAWFGTMRPQCAECRALSPLGAPMGVWSPSPWVLGAVGTIGTLAPMRRYNCGQLVRASCLRSC